MRYGPTWTCRREDRLKKKQNKTNHRAECRLIEAGKLKLEELDGDKPELKTRFYN